MINQNTVFVLGAGSAKPYLFPTGEELKRKICDYFQRNYLRLPIWDEDPDFRSFAGEIGSNRALNY